MRSSDMFKVHKHCLSNQIGGNYKMKPSLMSQKVKQLDFQVESDSRGNSVQRSAKRQYYNSSRLSIDPNVDMNLVNELKRK